MSVNKILLNSLVVGLFGTITNYIFVSPLPSLLSLTLLPWYFYYNRNSKILLHKFVFLLYAYFLSSIISTLLYYPVSFLQYNFYRYDGNFIISYAPILIIPFFSYKFDIDNFFKKFLIFTTSLNGVAFIVHMLITNFSLIYDWTNPSNYFHGLFKSTNAAGGFLSIILSLNIIIMLRDKSRRWRWLFIINILLLISTTSRGSLLGLLMGFAFFFLDIKNKKKWIFISILTICLIQGVILCYTYPIFDEYIRGADLTEVSLTEYITPLFGSVETKSANIYIRVIDTWPRGLDCFLHSPVFGSGFGSVNDVPLQYDNNSYLFSFNNQGNKTFDDAHAHHSYLHILGEQGIFGLFLFLSFWISVYKFIRKGTSTISRDFLLVSFFNLTMMSFTEHRITSPSNASPFVISFCLYVLWGNSYKVETIRNNVATEQND